MPATRGPTRTLQIESFEGMNREDYRTAIGDQELWWCENAQPIGRGQLQIVPAPGAAVATLSQGIATLWGVVLTLGGTSQGRLIAVGQDGSLTAVAPTGATTVMGGAGTVTTAARLTTWKDQLVLIADPTNGYLSWDGTTLLKYPVTRTGNTTSGSPVVTGTSTTGLLAGMAVAGTGIPTSTSILSVDSASQFTMTNNATATGTGVTLTLGSGAPGAAQDVAVYAGRAWLLTGARTVTFTGPNSWTDFTGASAAGSTTITDAAFQGSVVRLLSALEQLWIVGPFAVESLSNVRVSGSPAVTTYSLSNVVANVGAALPSSLTPFFRTLVFLTPYGVYALVGATPQKLSDKLDGLFPLLTFGADAPAATFVLNGVYIWAVLVTYNDPQGGPRPVLLCFARRRWFVLSLGAGVRWITTLDNPATGQPELWATDGTTIFQAFRGTGATAYSIQSKLWDFGAFTQRKQLLRVAAALQSDTGLIQMTTSVETESASTTLSAAVAPLGSLVFVGSSPITFVGTSPIQWVPNSIQVARGAVGVSGQYVGLRFSGASPPFRVIGLALEVEPLGEWTGP